MIANVVHRILRWGLQAALAATAFLAPSALAQTPIQTQDANGAGVAADLMECKREDGVLSLRLRLRNTADKPAEITLLDGRNYDAYYVTAANKKYFVLRDTEKNALAPAASGSGSLRVTLAKGEAYTWWAKYPAPPADVKKVSYLTPIAPPFDNVPIKD